MRQINETEIKVMIDHIDSMIEKEKNWISFLNQSKPTRAVLSMILASETWIVYFDMRRKDYRDHFMPSA